MAASLAEGDTDSLSRRVDQGAALCTAQAGRCWREAREAPPGKGEEVTATGREG